MRIALALMTALVVTSTPALAAKTKKGPATARSDDEVICRRYAVTGSLTEKVKVCHTRRDWKRVNDENRTDNEKMQETRVMTPNG